MIRRNVALSYLLPVTFVIFGAWLMTRDANSPEQNLVVFYIGFFIGIGALVAFVVLDYRHRRSVYKEQVGRIAAQGKKKIVTSGGIQGAILGVLFVSVLGPRLTPALLTIVFWLSGAEPHIHFLVVPSLDVLIVFACFFVGRMNGKREWQDALKESKEH